MFAFVIAVVIWFAISFQLFPTVTEHVPNIPVTAAPTALMLEKNLEISGSTIADTNAVVTGKRFDISKLSAADFKAYLDLSEVDRPGEYTVKIIVQPQSENFGCEVVNSNTAHIKVIETLTREFTVTADLSGITVRDDMKIDTNSVTIKPDRVTISGERGFVSSIASAVVKPASSEVLPETTELRAAALYRSLLMAVTRLPTTRRFP